MLGTAGADGRSGHQHAAGTSPKHRHHAMSATFAGPSGAAAVGKAANVAHTDTAADLGKIGELAKFSCSACAACCVGAAMVASNAKLPLADQAIERIVSTFLPYIGFVTDGPQRPPRSVLA